MAIVSEVLNAVKEVAEGIENIRKISEAVRDGRDYLMSTHADVASELAAMCEEMKKSLMALASASSIVTHFRFVLGDNPSGEAARFNNHLLNHKAKAEGVRQQLESMRGHCHIIKTHADRIQSQAEARGLRSIYAFLGLHSEQKEKELADALQEIYNDEMDFYRTIQAMEQAVQSTLTAVQVALGPPGTIDPSLIPQAASVLGEHVPLFSDLETKANFYTLELQSSIDTLTR